METGFFVGLLRTIMSFLDNIGIWLVEQIYNLFKLLTEVVVFSPTIIRDMGERIYALLGIIMLFKLSFSFLNYIVNPDSFSDKTVGFGKLIQHIVIVLVAIVGVPFVFRAAMDVQKVIIADDVIPRMLLGINKEEAQGDTDFGKFLAFKIMSGFISVDPLVVPECEGDYSDDCAKAIASGADTKDLPKGIVAENLSFAYANNDATFLLKDSMYNVNADGKYVFTYNGIISAIVLLGTATILLAFCFDVAVRAVKLAFLEIIAPIPLIAYLDPKTGKGVTEKWVKQCISCYLDLFMRMALIFFAIFAINQFTTYGMVEIGDKASGVQKVLLNVFMIFGILLFAKQVPELISEMTGIKMSGGGIFKTALAGLGIAGAVGGKALAIGATGAAGFGAGLSSGLGAAVAKYKGMDSSGTVAGFKALGSGFAGFATGSARGLGAAAKTKGFGKFGAASVTSRVAKDNLRERGDSKTGQRFKAGVAKSFGLDTGYEAVELKLKNQEDVFNMKKKSHDANKEELSIQIKKETKPFQDKAPIFKRTASLKSAIKNAAIADDGYREASDALEVAELSGSKEIIEAARKNKKNELTRVMSQRTVGAVNDIVDNHNNDLNYELSNNVVNQAEFSRLQLDASNSANLGTLIGASDELTTTNDSEINKVNRKYAKQQESYEKLDDKYAAESKELLDKRQAPEYLQNKAAHDYANKKNNSK